MQFLLVKLVALIVVSIGKPDDEVIGRGGVVK